MTSPALVDLWDSIAKLPDRERILGYARLMLGATYIEGGKSAKPIDGIIGRMNPIDCSGFVRAVFDQVFPEEGLGSRNDLNALKFQAVDLFVDVDVPTRGDIVCWNGHVGIVYDTDKKIFVGSQTSTGVMYASYSSGYWATTRTVKKFRKWKTL